ncbi:adenylosuccinate lyase, partial [Candidatus Auribacterota bacterium]
MIKRYTLPDMGNIWSEKNKFDIWLKIELFACEANAELGLIPKQALNEIKTKARYNINKIPKIEAEVKHDVIAFLTSVAEFVGPASRYIHLGLTSSDILDTALSVMMKDAVTLLIEELKKLIKIVKQQAKEHKYTVMMGRSHGIHAEPITFGFKMALMLTELVRSLKRLEQAKETISFGKISGAVGTHANVDPFVEKYVCQKLGLSPAIVSTQVLQRDRHAEYMSHIALTGAVLEKYAQEIRHLQRTEVLEVEEFFSKGQKGSSAMPHKRNPITCERVCGLSRILRSNALTSIENIPLWHERDITHSSVERVIIPDSTILLHYMLNKMQNIMENLLVYPENMQKNIKISKGMIFSQRVLLELAKKGMTREKAYSLVQ